MANVVLTSSLITLGSTSAASFMPRKYGGHGTVPAPKLLFGTALTFAGLASLADVAPAVANPLSVAIALTALTYYGLPILDCYFVKEGNCNEGK